MRHTVFVDGQEGTTGLCIHELLQGREELELILINPDKRKDPEERARLLNEADVAVLCLPDDAAREAVSWVKNPKTRIIDASTAHRTAPDWDYGIPELSPRHREAVRGSNRVSNSGCYAAGFVTAIYPLVAAGILSPDERLACFGVSSYSGAGKKLIAQYEASERGSVPPATDHLKGNRAYALGLQHKHLPEMAQMSGLRTPPLFSPSVGDFARGMLVSVPLFSHQLGGASAKDVHSLLAAHYQGEPFVRVTPMGAGWLEESGNFLDATGCNNTNRLDLCVFGQGDQVLLVSRLDNLGKGASGGVVQCMNLMLGLPETTGLTIAAT